MDHNDHNAHPQIEEALGKIVTGGRYMVHVARQRALKALDALDAGDFTAAYSEFALAAQGVGQLSNAQANLGIADDSRLMEARHLKVGMTMRRLGEISECEFTECSAADCEGHVTVKVGGEHEWQLSGDQEVWVLTEDVPDTENHDPMWDMLNGDGDD